MKKVVLLLFLSAAFVGIAQETYVISTDSKLSIDGTSTVHDWTVLANTMTGGATAEIGLPKTIEFEVPVAEIQSERGAAMDKKMHAALKKEEHPMISFNLTEVENSDNLKGKLNIAGQEKTVDIPVEINTDGSSLKISGEYAITLQDYGIEPPTAMFDQIIVGNDVTVKFDLVFSKNQ